MARENQGLQIALIVFVMLTIILGVTTYLFFRQYEEADIRAKSNAAEATKKAQLAEKSETDANELKRLIGAAKTEDVEAITTLFNGDMNRYGGSYSEESRFYRPLLEKMLKTIEEKNGELKDAKDEILRLEDQYAVRESNKDPQMKRFQEERDKANQDLADEQSKYGSERDRITQEQAKLQAALQSTRKEATASVAKVETKLQDAGIQNKKLVAVNEEQAGVIEKITSGKIDVANGEVLWINQRNRTVWINLGRSDSLGRQVTFGVYPIDVSGMTIKGKKASIEVTQVFGDHLAEARILEDEIGDPIVPGDKIYTPLWTPGKKRHFALAGLIDIDDDGRSDLQTVLNLINLNGGVVDCYIADRGKEKNKLVGEIGVGTNCLILGEPPTEKGDPGQLAAFTKVLRDADQLRIQKMQLGDMLQSMGWVNLSPVVRFGRGANPKDFRAKPAEGVPKKSTGNVSDLFKPRRPPKTPASAY